MAAQASYVTPPQQALAKTHQPHRAHYPPASYTTHKQDYATVPLHDLSATHARGSPSPVASGTNTPNGSANKKKPWTFLPTHSFASLESSIGGDLEKRKRPKNNRNTSWDLLGERAEWEEYNPAQCRDQQGRRTGVEYAECVHR